MTRIPEGSAQPDTVPRAAEIDETKVRSEFESWRKHFDMEKTVSAWSSLSIYRHDYVQCRWEGYLARAREEAAVHAQKDTDNRALIERYLETVQKQCADLSRQQARIATLEARLKEIESAETVKLTVYVGGETYVTSNPKLAVGDHVLYRHPPALSASFLEAEPANANMLGYEQTIIDFDEARVDIVGANGNSALHYPEVMRNDYPILQEETK